MNIKQAAFYAVAVTIGAPLMMELIRFYCIMCVAIYNFIR